MAFDQSQATSAIAMPTTTICQTSPMSRSRVSGLCDRLRRAGSGVEIVTAQDPSDNSDLRPVDYHRRFGIAPVQLQMSGLEKRQVARHSHPMGAAVIFMLDGGGTKRRLEAAE